MLTCKSSTGALVAGALFALSMPALARGAGEGPYDEPESQPGQTADGKSGAAGDEAPKCPPGAYCEEAEVAPPPELANPGAGASETAAGSHTDSATAGETTVVLPPRPPGSDPNAPRVLVVQPSTGGAPGQVVVYEAGAAPPHLPGAYEPVRPVPPPPPPPVKRKWRRHRAWGANLRFDGAIMPRYRVHTEAAGMVGLGLGFRFRPVPFFALGLDADFMGGIDSMGYERRELPMALNAIWYPNPRDVVQFYAFGGPHFSYATVYSDRDELHLAEGTSDEYTYVGGQLGIGLEFRVSPLVGINFDGYGVLRARADDDGDGRVPELFDARTGETANAMGYGVLRGGATFWW